MNRPYRFVIPFVFILPLLLLFPVLSVRAESPTEVHVNNFPEMQKVKGSVGVEGTVSHGVSFKREGIVVPPSRRSELSEMARGGVVDTEGFTTLCVSMQGEMRSESFSSGTIGVLLVPDEQPVLRALREAKIIQYPIESVASVKGGTAPYFSSEQVRESVAFPRYRIFLYNTINKPVEANVYLYLTN